MVGSLYFILRALQKASFYNPKTLFSNSFREYQGPAFPLKWLLACKWTKLFALCLSWQRQWGKSGSQAEKPFSCRLLLATSQRCCLSREQQTNPVPEGNGVLEGTHSLPLGEHGPLYSLVPPMMEFFPRENQDHPFQSECRWFSPPPPHPMLPSI